MRFWLLLGFWLTASFGYGQSLDTPQPTETKVERFTTNPFERSPQGETKPERIAPPVETRVTSIERDEPHRNRLSFDLLVGLPTAVRAQLRFDHTRWMLEGVFGFVPFPGGGVGLRRNGLIVGDADNALYLNPGIGLYFMHVRTSGFLFGNQDQSVVYAAFDLDLLWKRQVAEGLVIDFGVKFGFGVGGGNGGFGALPIFALMYGLHF
jgi:hypothetical protein